MKKINLKSIALFIATLGLLIFLHLVGWLAPVERMIFFVFNPPAAQLQSWSDSLNKKYSNSVRQGNLAAQVADLQSRVEALTAQNADLKKLQDENSVLRQHLKFLDSGQAKKYVLANVVSRDILNGPEESLGDLVIDRGSDDGIMPGLAVLDETGAV
ncbi:MAG TPA: hypothetical protein VMC41_03975, partial [Candidatus Nanoarchaeia archaeon]|nr:hypothetical protein [Candidatus Nanoarchaeia archaeon]